MYGWNTMQMASFSLSNAIVDIAPSYDSFSKIVQKLDKMQYSAL